MTQPFKNAIADLLRNEGETCISILMPTRRGGPDAKQDPIRLRNLLRRAEEKLLEQRMPEEEIKRLLKPMREGGAAGEGEFWKHPQEGLAIFRSPDFFYWASTPVPIPELCVVGRHFDVKSLLWLAKPGREFFVLTLSARAMHLFQSEGGSLKDVTPASVAAILAEELDDRHRRCLESHTAGPDSFYHGPGSAADLEAPFLESRFRRADRELAEWLKGGERPVILVGTEPVQSLFRALCTFPNRLVDRGVAGNTEYLTPKEFWDACWPVAQAHFESLEKRAAEEFERAEERGQASADLSTVLALTSSGRAGRVMVARDHQVWGTFDRKTSRTVVHGTRAAYDEDLLNTVARLALDTGAKLEVLSPEYMPHQSMAAAVFRY